MFISMGEFPGIAVGVIPNSLKLMMSETVQGQGKRQELHLLLQSVLRNIGYADRFLQ